MFGIMLVTTANARDSQWNRYKYINLIELMHLRKLLCYSTTRLLTNTAKIVHVDAIRA